MAYTPTTWSNDEAPAINETNLNKMETGIDEAHDHIASTSNPHSVTAAQAGAAESDHNHAGTYEPADATILKQADVDDVPVNSVTTAPVSSNWAYDHANTHAPSNADNTAANETSHADVVVDADIGVNVAAYDHNHDADYADIANEHAESHTVASHSDTSATGAELDELTDGSTTSLHSHAGGGASKEYASFYLSTGGVTGVAGTETTLVINSTSVNSDTDIFELASNQVTVNKTADFEVSFQVSFNSGGSSRTSYGIWIDRDGVTEPGTYTETYQRGYDSGDTAAMSIILSITSGEVFQLRVLRADGSGSTGYQDNNGTRLTFKEM
jgi:hypothetical protein